MIVIVQHHVRDFDAWRPVFEDHRAFREQYGCSGHLLYRSMDDPGDVTIVMQFPSRERAEAFARDPGLKEAMDRGGVDSEPRMSMLHEVGAADYASRRAA